MTAPTSAEICMGYSIDLSQSKLLGYTVATGGIVVGSFLISPLHNLVDLANIALLYVLAVVLVGTQFGRGPAIYSGALSAVAYAYVFVPPHFSLAITEPQYLLTAGIMFLVALLVGHLTATLKSQADTLAAQAASASALYQLASSLTSKLTADDVTSTCLNYFCNTLQVKSPQFLFTAQFSDPPRPLTAALVIACVDRGVAVQAQAPRKNEQVVLLPISSCLSGKRILFFSATKERLASPALLEEAETVAALVGGALERVELAEKAREIEMQRAAQALRCTILSSLSHDIRTPLTSLMGMADTLALGNWLTPERQQTLLKGLRTQAHETHHLVTNLLEMAKLQSGAIELQLAWQPIEEVIGATLALCKEMLAEREVQVDLAPGLPPVRIDAALIERVIWNLIENACKYSPAGSAIEIVVRKVDLYLMVAVCDEGNGLPPGKEGEIFKLFERGEVESAIPGVGLGLAIVHAILDAHHGRVEAKNRPEQGACFSILIPLGEPPVLGLDAIDG